MKKLISAALEAGASKATLMEIKDIVVDERTRLKCSVPRCYAYDRCLTCPPHTMSVEEFRRILSRYKKAMIVQVETDQNSMDKSSASLGSASPRIFKEHIERLRPFNFKLLGVIERVEQAAFKSGYAYAAGFGAGRCFLCGDECPGILDGRCRHPFRARPAMEAMGIDIRVTAKNAGLSVELSSQAPIKFSGLILID